MLQWYSKWMLVSCKQEPVSGFYISLRLFSTTLSYNTWMFTVHEECQWWMIDEMTLWLFILEQTFWKMAPVSGKGEIRGRFFSIAWKEKGNTNNKNIFQSKTRCAFLGDVFFYNLYLENIFFEIIFAFEILIKN